MCIRDSSNIKDFINLTFCCQQATVITDFSDLDAIGRQHYMTMQGGGCRIEELERLARRVDVAATVRLLKLTIPEYKSRNSAFEEFDRTPVAAQ